VAEVGGGGRAPVLTGGCQCGAVRYALYAAPDKVDICHCRMCQRAMGNFFMAEADVALDDFAWTRGEPARFESSAQAERYFCRRCGTPLGFRYLEEARLSVTVGSLDQPERAEPTLQYGIESRLPWIDRILATPGATTRDTVPGGEVLSHQARIPE